MSSFKYGGKVRVRKSERGEWQERYFILEANGRFLVTFKALSTEDFEKTVTIANGLIKQMGAVEVIVEN